MLANSTELVNNLPLNGLVSVSLVASAALSASVSKKPQQKQQKTTKSKEQEVRVEEPVPKVDKQQTQAAA